MWHEDPAAGLDFALARKTVLESVDNLDLQGRLLAHESEISDMRTALIDAIESESVETLRKEDFQFSDIARAETDLVYTKHIVDKSSPGRHFYDLVRLADWCPQCWEREVDEVDHFLPKSKFHGLSMVFENLVPICIKCNRKKGNSYPRSGRKAPFHPYYEDHDHLEWLLATVKVDPEPHLEFSVSPSLAGTPLAARIFHHIERFELNKYYGKLMARAISSAATSWTNWDSTASQTEYLGESEVRDDCEYRSREGRTRSRNSWSAAGWLACKESTWFCQGGFVEFVRR